MKKILAALALIVGLCSFAPSAHALVPQTYIAVATATAPGGEADLLAFQNTSADIDVRINRIDLCNATNGGAITGGYAQYWVMGSTQITHGGTGQTRAFSLSSANASKPSYISFSTGPVSVQYENTAGGYSLPLIKPLIVNIDETATADTCAIYDVERRDGEAIMLPHGSSRGIVIRQRNMAATSYTAGVVFVRIYYTVK